MALAVASMSTGCYQPPPAQHAALVISPSGEMTLQGHAVTPARLQPEIERLAAQAPSLVVEIRASTHTPIADVQRAVATTKAARAVVAFGMASD